MLTYESWAAYDATLVRDLPLEPVQGKHVTAADMILEDPRAERREVKKDSKFAASFVE